MSRKVQKTTVKKEVVQSSPVPQEDESLLLFANGKEVLPGDLLTALEKLGYDQANPKLYHLVNDLEKDVTGKMSVVNVARVLKTKPTEDELRQVHRAFTLGDHNEIGVDDLVRVANIVDEDTNQPFGEWVDKLSANKKGFTYDEMVRILTTQDEVEEEEE
jgi:Ca2+-binding EF-hand superfamily protein